MPVPKPKLETRTIKSEEIRAVSDDGVFEGYACKWGSTDSYNSRFIRGAFKKTLQERAGKIKVFYNHDKLIGSALELREDDQGLWVRGRVNLETTDGANTHALMRAGDLDGLSFAFTPVKEKRAADGVRDISEVKLYEFGPVDFPANEEAAITDVRSFLDLCENGECRATDFTQTLDDNELLEKGYALTRAIWHTLDDIWWSDEPETLGDRLALFDAAIEGFHAEYLTWAGAYIERFWPDSESRSAPAANALAREFRSQVGVDVDQLVAETSLTKDEARSLSHGQPIQARHKLRELPDAVQIAHAEARSNQIAELFAGLREGLSPAESTRALALLQPAAKDRRQSEPVPNEISAKVVELGNVFNH